MWEMSVETVNILDVHIPNQQISKKKNYKNLTQSTKHMLFFSLGRYLTLFNIK